MLVVCGCKTNKEPQDIMFLSAPRLLQPEMSNIIKLNIEDSPCDVVRLARMITPIRWLEW